MSKGYELHPHITAQSDVCSKESVSIFACLCECIYILTTYHHITGQRLHVITASHSVTDVFSAGVCV